MTNLINASKFLKSTPSHLLSTFTCTLQHNSFVWLFCPLLAAYTYIHVIQYVIEMEPQTTVPLKRTHSFARLNRIFCGNENCVCASCSHWLINSCRLHEKFATSEDLYHLVKNERGKNEVPCSAQRIFGVDYAAAQVLFRYSSWPYFCSQDLSAL